MINVEPLHHMGTLRLHITMSPRRWPSATLAYETEGNVVQLTLTSQPTESVREAMVVKGDGEPSECLLQRRHIHDVHL